MENKVVFIRLSEMEKRTESKLKEGNENINEAQV